MKMVTALEFWQSSITNMRSLVVPKVNSRTVPAFPNLSAVSSEKRGTIRPPVAIAISCNVKTKSEKCIYKVTNWHKNIQILTIQEKVQANFFLNIFT